MRWTDEQTLRRFFTQRMVPAAQTLRDRGVKMLSMAPDVEADTWYDGPPRDEPDFVAVDPAACERLLRALWERQGLPELADLAAELMRLARALERDAEPAAELSPSLYVMY
jgi:hypothetical protein